MTKRELVSFALGLLLAAVMGLTFREPRVHAQDSTTLLSGFLVNLRAGRIVIPATVFASLGTPVDGTFIFCSDCTIASPCAGSGTGAFAKRLASTWVCN